MGNEKVLIDSSVWIEYFRAGEGKIFNIVDFLLDSGQAVLCGVVEMEIIAGIKKSERAMIKDLFNALHYIETNREDFIAAGERLNNLRKKGITIPATDSLIATLALDRKISVLTIDKHFNHFKELKRVSL